jgi:membrane protein
MKNEPKIERKFSLSWLMDFLKTGIWRIRIRELTGRQSFLIRQLRIFILAARGFVDDRCHLRASALTYYSLLSVVPLLALAFGVSKGFGLETRLRNLILQAFPDQEEISNQIIEFAHTLLQNTQGGLIAGIGVAVLLWTIIKVMGNIENSFNDIWGVRKGRSLGSKFTDYLSLILIIPLLFVMASSATVLISSQVAAFTEGVKIFETIGSFLSGLLKLLPYAVVWVLFTILYIYMPNTQVKMKSAVMGGILAGTIYQIVQWVYIKFQIGVSTYGAIYGSFAALPLFLVWLQTSWLVVLFGAEISFAEQNVDTYEFEPDCEKASNKFKKIVSLHITHACVKRFQAQEEPWSAEKISESLEIPIRLVRQLLSELTEARILSEVRPNGRKRCAYQPARAIESLTVLEVINLLDERGIDGIPHGESPLWQKLAQRLTLFNDKIREASADVALNDL